MVSHICTIIIPQSNYRYLFKSSNSIPINSISVLHVSELSLNFFSGITMRNVMENEIKHKKSKFLL